MGLVRDILTSGVEFVREEILPIRMDLIKAGILSPDAGAYDPKATNVDPNQYGQLNYGYKEKYAILDYSKCRQITYADPIVAAIIQTRLNQVAAFAEPQVDQYKIGYKISLVDPEAIPTAADKKKSKEMEKFMLTCGVPEAFEDTPELKKRDSFETFLRKIARDTLTFDQINFEVIPRRNGMPYAFSAVDAATVRLVPDKKEQVERMGGPRDQSLDHIFSYSDKHFKEYKSKTPRYVQIINGVVHHTFDEWELAFGVRNPRTDIWSSGYGFSEIEMLVTTITSHMNAETYNRKFFSQGSSVKGMISFEGGVPPDQLESFRRQWYQQVAGVNNAWKTPMIALGKEGKLNWTSMHSNNREMEFGKWMEYCIKTICGVFQIDPIEIGFDISRQGAGQGGNSSGGGMGYTNQAERLMYSQDKGLRPLMNHIQNLLNEYIVFRLDPRFKFEFVGLNGIDEKDELDKTEKKIKTFKTINEIRAEHDMEPLKEKVGNFGDLILDASLIQYVTQKEQAEAQEAMPQPGAEGEQPPEGMPGMFDVPDQGQEGAGAEEEPDYENMDEDALSGELDKLNKSLEKMERIASGKPEFFKEIDL